MAPPVKHKPAILFRAIARKEVRFEQEKRRGVIRSNPTGVSEFAIQALWEIYQNFTQSPIVNFYLEEDQDLDKVLNIFIRVNSGGTELSYSDLLLSTATAQWKSLDARETINALVEELNGPDHRFTFDKDLIMKACLVLTDLTDIRFKVTNFNSANMKHIEDNWKTVAESLRMAVGLAIGFGFNSYRVASSASP